MPNVTPYYADDHVTLYHGDALQIMGNIEADVLVTDPPYGIGWKRGSYPARGHTHQDDGIENDESTATRDAALDLWGNARPSIVFGSLYAPFPTDLRQVLIWHKPPNTGVIGSTTGYRRDAETIFLRGPIDPRKPHSSSIIRSHQNHLGGPYSHHPHQKPVDLMAELIGIYPGVILDPFAGSGSTLRAAKDHDRRAIGIELEEEHCETIAARCAQEVLAI